MNENINDKNADKTFKEILSGIVWAVRLQFSISPVQYVVYTLARIICAISPVLSAYFSARIINQVVFAVANNSAFLTQDLIQTLIIIAIINIAAGIMEHVSHFVELNMNHRWHWKAGSMFLRRNAELDFKYHEDPDFKILYKKVEDNMDWSVMFITQKWADLLGLLISFTSVIGILSVLNPVLIIIVSVPIIFTYFINKKYGKALYAFWDDKGETKIHMSKAKDALEEPDILRESKIYGFSDYIVKRFADAHEIFMNTQYRVLSRKAFWLSMVTIINNVIYLGIQAWLVLQVIVRHFSIGDYTFYFTSLSNLTNQLSEIEDRVNLIRERARYAVDAKMFFEMENDIKFIENPVLVENIAPSIEFKNVSFKYPNQDVYVLKNLSFKIDKKQRVALVGKNGAGKTTIIKLLARFYDVSEGEILINGVNIKNIDIKSYYKIWGCLFQSFAKLWLTPRENIGIGNVEDMQNMDLIESAAKKTGADEFIEKLKTGYDNYLANDFEGGIDLSGGQWQKIGIARSIFANPKFIVLDEPTSALDALAEIEVFKQIEKLSSSATMLIVSHRFATVRQANRILVLDNGEIVEQGTHEVLMENKGLYSKMFSAQAKGYK